VNLPGTSTDVEAVLECARQALHAAPPVGDPAYQRYTRLLGEALVASWPALRAANQRDLAAAAQRLPATIVDRLRLDTQQLEGLLARTAEVRSALPQVTGAAATATAGGWGTLRAVPKPLGVVLMVYEARPTVTVEGALLAPAVGNAVLLRGGREMAHTDAAMAGVVHSALEAAGLPTGLVTVLDDPDRRVFRALLGRPDKIDVLIPRGSPSLIDFCRQASTIPVLASGGGVNHLYVHRDADLGLAARITLDSKAPEPTACNTLEMALVDRSVAAAYLAALVAEANRTGTAIAVRSAMRPAGEPAAGATSGVVTFLALDPEDLGREFLDVTVGVLPVDGPRQAAEHIQRYGSGHTEGIVTADPDVADRFVNSVDAAAIVVNGSLRLHDGPTLGLGPELSISTGRMHVRGPVTLGDLVTFSWRVDAAGTTRADAGRHLRAPAPLPSRPMPVLTALETADVH
jgi:glutamate-5-semialdehyde dehydrogenase